MFLVIILYYYYFCYLYFFDYRPAGGSIADQPPSYYIYIYSLVSTCVIIYIFNYKTVLSAWWRGPGRIPFLFKIHSCQNSPVDSCSSSAFNFTSLYKKVEDNGSSGERSFGNCNTEKFYTKSSLLLTVLRPLYIIGGIVRRKVGNL